MSPVKAETVHQAHPGDDGDPHLLDPIPRVLVRQRFRPSLFERFAILGGAELELTLSDTGAELAVADTA